ncbi:DUF1559 domain-containing protein [Planctomycetota bacterium]
MNRKRGFTLIELLVVIAVIAVLMGILMPALQKARQQAKRTICASNVKQVGVGMHMYAESWDGRVLPYTTPTGATNWSEAMPWWGVIVYNPGNTDGNKHNPMHLAILHEERLIEDPKVFYCPSQPRTSAYPLQYNYSFYTEEGPWGSYTPEALSGGHTSVRTSYNYWTHGRGKLHELAQYPIVVDNLQEWEVIPHRAGEGRPQGVSALFGDGHVSFCTGGDLFDEGLWARQEGVYNGPGNKPKLFEDLLTIIRLNNQ